MNQVTTQEVKVNRSQIIADVDVSGNLKMDREAYEDLQLLAASDSWCDDGLASPFRLSTVHIWKIYLASNTMHPVKGFRVRCSLVGGRPGQIIHPAWVKRSKSYWHKIWDQIIIHVHCSEKGPYFRYRVSIGSFLLLGSLLSPYFYFRVLIFSVLAKQGGGCKRPFGNFPKNHPFLIPQASLSSTYILSSFCFGTILAALSLIITSNILCITLCERYPSQLCPCRR